MGSGHWVPTETKPRHPDERDVRVRPITAVPFLSPRNCDTRRHAHAHTTRECATCVHHVFVSHGCTRHRTHAHVCTHMQRSHLHHTGASVCAHTCARHIAHTHHTRAHGTSLTRTTHVRLAHCTHAPHTCTHAPHARPAHHAHADRCVFQQSESRCSVCYTVVAAVTCRWAALSRRKDVTGGKSSLDTRRGGVYRGGPGPTLSI